MPEEVGKIQFLQGFYGMHETWAGKSASKVMKRDEKWVTVSMVSGGDS